MKKITTGVLTGLILASIAGGATAIVNNRIAITELKTKFESIYDLVKDSSDRIKRIEERLMNGVRK